jgi:hypothetical protein
LSILLTWFTSLNDGATLIRTGSISTLIAAASLSIGGRRKAIRDPLALGAFLLFAAAFALLFLLYDMNYFRGIRSLLFTFPLCAVAASPVLAAWSQEIWSRLCAWLPGWAAQLVVIAATLFVLYLSHTGSRSVAALTMASTYGEHAIRALERVDIARERLLVSSFDISADYMMKYYPIRWSFVPSNLETLRLLDSTHAIGTLIFPERHLKSRFPQEELQRMGFFLQRRFVFRGYIGNTRWVVFDRSERDIIEENST